MANINSSYFEKNLNWVSEHFGKYERLYRLYGDYYNGKHKNLFKDFGENNPNHKELAEIINHLKDNMCKVVVDSIASRLQLDGFDIDNDKTKKWVDDYFAKNRITSIAKAVHRDTILYGDGYVTVFPDENGKPVIKAERPYTIAVKYDIDQNIEVAVKWVIEKIDDNKHISHYWIYTKDKIYRRYKEGIVCPSNWELLNAPEEKKDMVNPYKRVPIFHFFNGIRADAFCRSDLGDVVPLQIALNKELQSRELSSDLSAFKQKWMTGVAIPVDENGKPMTPLRNAIDSVWQFNSPDVRLGEFSPTDLGNYNTAIYDLREEISRVSRVPFHIMGLGGSFPSGEALKTAEAPLIAKVEDKQLMFGDVWEDVFKMVCDIAKQPYETISAIWKNTMPHSEAEQWQIANMKREIGVSTDQLLTELGYTDDEIKEFDKIREEEVLKAIPRWQVGAVKKELGVSTKQILTELGYTEEQVAEFEQEKEQEQLKAMAMMNGVGQDTFQENQNPENNQNNQTGETNGKEEDNTRPQKL